MMEEIDSELRRENVRIDRRQIAGFTKVGTRLRAKLTFAPLAEPAIAGKYEGDSLSAHILGWFKRRYGDRLNMDFSVGRVAVVIRNDPWRLQIPRVFGTVTFVCDQRLAVYRGRPSFAPSGHIAVFNILNSIEDLPDGLAGALRHDELDAIASFFISAGQAVYSLEEIVDQPFVTEATDDLRSAVDHLLSKPSANCGFSKWSSAQFIEKLLKAFLENRSSTFRRTHNLSELADLVEQRGLALDRTALLAIQCAPAVRYNSRSIAMADAVAAHHHSLALCHTIARGISGKPPQVQWTVERRSGS